MLVKGEEELFADYLKSIFSSSTNNELARNLFIDVNPIMPKAALAKMGVCGEQVRLPLIPTTQDNKKKLFDAMDAFEKLGY